MKNETRLGGFSQVTSVSQTLRLADASGRKLLPICEQFVAVFICIHISREVPLLVLLNSLTMRD